MGTAFTSTPRIFVSHSHQDAVFCRAYVNGLRALGLDVWYDEHNLGSGALRSAIERELQNRDHFIVILSPAAMSSDWVNAEIDAALTLMRRGQMRMFLPVVAEACDIPVLLDRYKRITTFDGGSFGVDEAVARTLQAISRAVDDSAAGAPFVAAVPPARFAPGTELFVYSQHADSIWTIEWSPDGQKLATGGSDKTVQVWDALTGDDRLVYDQHTGTIYAAAWSPDGKWLASGGDDKTVQVWSTEDGHRRVTYGGHSMIVYTQTYGGHLDTVQRIAWAPDGGRIASSDFKSLQVWDVTTGRIIETIGAGFPREVAWRPDWKYLASPAARSTGDILADRGAKIEVIDSETQKAVQVFQGDTNALAWALDGKRLASCSRHTVSIWDWANPQRPLVFRGHSDTVHAVSWSPQGRLLASIDASGVLYIWDARNCAIVLTIYADSGYGARVAWSPDGEHIASSGGDGIVRVWQAPLTSSPR